MRHSPEALTAFAEAASLGSFSAASRKLGKSQSTISSAIANLEVDLGLSLFDRSSRKPTLTPQGRVVLLQVQGILEASDRLDRCASQLASGLEARLGVVWSDTYQSDSFDQLLIAFEQRFPDLAFESLIAEHEDLVSLVQTGRADIGVVAAQASYPPDIGSATLAEQSEIALYAATSHPLASQCDISAGLLADHRELRLTTYMQGRGRADSHLTADASPLSRRVWTTPSYLMLLEMAALGFGWAAIPRWMVNRFAVGKLVELKARGWPKRVTVDIVWSRKKPLGQAASWLLDQMLAPGPESALSAADGSKQAALGQLG